MLNHIQNITQKYRKHNGSRSKINFPLSFYFHFNVNFYVKNYI